MSDDRELLRCDMCKYYNEGTSECRFNPPVHMLDPQYDAGRPAYNNFYSKWPDVKLDDWCGKWNS